VGPKQESEQVDRGSDEISGRSNRNAPRGFLSKKSFPFVYATILSSVFCWVAVRSGREELVNTVSNGERKSISPLYIQNVPKVCSYYVVFLKP
jgi:hypothetical protein